MATKTEKPEKQEAAADADKPEAKPSRSLPLKSLLIAGGVLLMEAVTVVVMMMLNHGPAAAAGAAPENTPLVQNEDVEEMLLEGKAANCKRGSTYVYRFRIFAVLDKKDVAAVKGTLDKHKATVEDTVRQVVARLDPKDLDDDPKLVTFRRVLIAELEPVFGPNKIKQLLVPEFPRTRVD